MTAEFVYFLRNIDGHPWIYIGHTSGRGKREIRDGWELAAIVQGTHEDEKQLHTYFASHRAPDRRSTSIYEGDEVHDYVRLLLERRLAGRDRTEALELGRVPWSSWSPANINNLHETVDGQITLFADLPAAERLEMARDDLAWLSSGHDDWYTPSEIIEAARRAMGSIDLDPATALEAQKLIGADVYYTKTTNGLNSNLPWAGNVWLNPPYGRGDTSAVGFIRRLIVEYGAGNVIQAITILNLASASAHWFDPVWEHAAIHLIWRGRPNFWNIKYLESSPTKGVIISYFGSHPTRFAAEFAPFGRLITVGYTGSSSHHPVQTISTDG